MPATVAIETAIIVGAVNLNTLGAASRAEAAPVEPIPVGIEAILDIVTVYGDGVRLRDPNGVAPGGDFEL